MIVRCINNDQARAPKVHEHGYRHPKYVFNDLSVGRDYFVYGMMISHDDLLYLVERDTGFARWSAPYLFEVVDPRIPNGWEFGYEVIEGSERLERIGTRAIWSYHAMVYDPQHNDNLHSSDDSEPGVAEDLAIFAGEVARRAELGY